MSQIEVPDWVAADVLSRYSALRIERGDSEPFPPELAVQQRQEDMHAALTAALGAWVVHEGSVRTLDLSFAREQGITLTHIFNKGKGAARTRTNIFTLRQEKPE